VSLPAELAALPLHVVARDYPETLALLRRRGVDVTRHGGLSVAEAAAAADVDAPSLLDALRDALAWREEEPG
jgi:hypothetical protein